MIIDAPDIVELPSDDEILHVSRTLAAVGRFSGGNASFEIGLTVHLKTFGPIEQMTVGDLLRECRAYNERFNERHRRIDAMLAEGKP